MDAKNTMEFRQGTLDLITLGNRFMRAVTSTLIPILLLAVLPQDVESRHRTSSRENLCPSGLSQTLQGNSPPPPSQAEVQARTQRLLANQHRNDDAIDQYERVERRIDRTSGPDPRVIDDKTYRVVPTGAGTGKILLKDGESKTDPNAYRQQLQLLESVLEVIHREVRQEELRRKYEILNPRTLRESEEEANQGRRA